MATVGVTRLGSEKEGLPEQKSFRTEIDGIYQMVAAKFWIRLDEDPLTEEDAPHDCLSLTRIDDSERNRLIEQRKTQKGWMFSSDIDLITNHILAMGIPDLSSMHKEAEELLKESRRLRPKSEIILVLAHMVLRRIGALLGACTPTREVECKGNWFTSLYPMHMEFVITLIKTAESLQKLRQTADDSVRIDDTPSRLKSDTRHRI